MVETFFKTIKSELIWQVAWQSRKQAENAVAQYIDGFYNPVRRHSGLPPLKWSSLKYGFRAIGGREHAAEEAQA